jgi:hypothetical protein
VTKILGGDSNSIFLFSYICLIDRYIHRWSGIFIVTPHTCDTKNQKHKEGIESKSMRMNECSRGDFFTVDSNSTTTRAISCSTESFWIFIIRIQLLWPQFPLKSEPPVTVLKEMFTINNLQLLDDYFSKTLHGIQEWKVKRKLYFSQWCPWLNCHEEKNCQGKYKFVKKWMLLQS